MLIGKKSPRQIARNITKQGKKLRVAAAGRVTATRNLVYEFNPLADTGCHSSSSASRTRSRTNSDQRSLPRARTGTTAFSKSTLNRDADLVKRRSSTLPELNSCIDLVTDDPDSNISRFDRTDRIQDISLPILSEGNVTRTLGKRLDDGYKRSDVDREVVNAKSTWRALREEKDWTRGKDRIVNARARKLYEMLEKARREIDEAQRRYADPKMNRYLRRSAINVLEAAGRPSLKEDAEIARSIIFPKKEARSGLKVSRAKNVDTDIVGKGTTGMRSNEAAGSILAEKQPTEDLLSSKNTAKKRAIRSYAHARNIGNNIGPIYTHIAPNTCTKQDAAVDVVKPAFKGGSKTRASIGSSIEGYLRRYSDNVHKLRDSEEKEIEAGTQDIKRSASDIADILASLDIETLGLYENFEECDDAHDEEERVGEKDERNRYLNNATSNTRTTFVRENGKICDETFPENTELKSHVRSVKVPDEKSSGTSKQSTIGSYEDNAFIKIGLNVLDENLSRDKLSQILQSEYLKRDLSI